MEDHSVPIEDATHPALSIQAFWHEDHAHISTELNTHKIAYDVGARMLRQIADAWEAQHWAAIAQTN